MPTYTCGEPLPAGEVGVPTIVSPHEDVPVELALDVLDQHGVDRAVLVQPMFRGEDNSYVAAVAAEAAARPARGRLRRGLSSPGCC